MTAILGLSAYYHDSAAALVVDGRIVAAAQEERFSRKRHDSEFPAGAVRYCLREAGLTEADLDYVGFYEKPLIRFNRLLETYLGVAPRGFQSFLRSMPIWLHEKLRIPRQLDTGLGGRYRGPYVYCEHHESHAASAFYPSPFEEAAILTLDGVGEWATGSMGVGRGNRIQLLRETRFPHSLGLLYSAFTYYTGFKVNSAEYKVMGLAPYGEPRFADAILGNLIDVSEDGSFRMDMRYFNYCQGLTMTSPRFHELFGGPPRDPKTPVTQREMDLAASVQKVTEEVVLRCARRLRAETGLKNLVLAGGVALNCVANGRVLREGPFDDLWIQPAAGDAGGALGVALFTWHQLLCRERKAEPRDGQQGSYLGPAYSDEEIRGMLAAVGAPHVEMPDEDSLVATVADHLAQERVVGWFQGRMEFGPRALGARSILGDPRSPRMQAVMNRKIKYRESFRPFAPAVLEELASDWFEIDRPSPYMLLVAPVAARLRREMTADERNRFGIDKLNVPRSSIPAVTHVDYSARLQTVSGRTNPRFHALLRAFHDRTGCPVLVNTSFNVRGEPIVCTPQDAYNCFLRTEIDCLVLGRFVLDKRGQRGLGLGSPATLRGDWSKWEGAALGSGYSLDD
jgi:carbamoyltransferase